MTASQPSALIVAPSIVRNDARLIKQAQVLEREGFCVTLVAASPHEDRMDGAVHPPRIGPRPATRLKAMAVRVAKGAGAAAAFERHSVDMASLKADVARRSPRLILASGPEVLPALTDLPPEIALIYDAHEFYQDETPGDRARARWVNRVEAAAAGRLDAFITVNQGIADLFADVQPGFPRAEIVHNAADGATPVDDGRLRASLGLGQSERILLYQGGLVPMRGLELLVEAARRLPSDWRVVLMGSGRLEAELRRAAAGGGVRFLPAVPFAELGLWTAGADLGALLYQPHCLNQLYCTPNKLWEYPAAGVPLLSFDLPEIRRLIGPYGAARFVTASATAMEIAEAISAVSPQDLAAMRQGAVRFSANNSWSISAEALKRAIAAALRRTEARRR